MVLMQTELDESSRDLENVCRFLDPGIPGKVHRVDGLEVRLMFLGGEFRNVRWRRSA